MTEEGIEQRILSATKRRTVYPKLEASLSGADLKEVRAAITRLRRWGMIYVSDKPLRNYFGSTEQGYRATTKAMQTP